MDTKQKQSHVRILIFFLAFLMIGISAGCSSGGGGGESTAEIDGNVNPKGALWDQMTWDVDQWG
jgi:hypothetical protein